jgi:hypothetical protein
VSERASRMANHHFATVPESLERAPLEVCAPHVSVCTPTRDARGETENGIPKFCCCCETHKRAHSPNPQARGPLSQCDGVFSICDENGRVSIATRNNGVWTRFHRERDSGV